MVRSDGYHFTTYRDLITDDPFDDFQFDPTQCNRDHYFMWAIADYSYEPTKYYSGNYKIMFDENCKVIYTRDSVRLLFKAAAVFSLLMYLI